MSLFKAIKEARKHRFATLEGVKYDQGAWHYHPEQDKGLKAYNHAMMTIERHWMVSKVLKFFRMI